MDDGNNSTIPPAPLAGADPAASANIYCSGQLDELIAEVVLPSWRDFEKQYERDAAAEYSFLWILRYSRCGEHLKLRWHGQAHLADGWRALVASHWDAFRERLAADPGLESRKVILTTPPIDHEDQATAAHPDRSLLWTNYRRSHVSLGYYPYLNDDGYVSGLVFSLGRSTEILLDALESKAGIVVDYRFRQTLFIKSLLTVLAALPLGEDGRTSFLHYQRDVLLRDYRKKKQRDQQQLEFLLGKFDAQLSQSGPAGQKWTDQAREFWRGGPEPVWMAPYQSWARSIRGLHDYVNPICWDIEHHIDPFAESPVFPALFKAVHGFSNQLGLKPLDEAFAYHFILYFLARHGHPVRPVQLRPIL